MNVLFLSETFPPNGSGAELATQYYADLLSQKKINVIVLTNQFNGQPSSEKRNNFLIKRVHIFNNMGSVKYSVLRRPDVLFSGLFKKLLTWADIVYVPRFWFSAIVAAKSAGKRVIIHLHDYIPVCSLSHLYNENTKQLCEGKKKSCASCIFRFEASRGKNVKQILSSTALNSTIGSYLPKLIRLADAIVCVSETQKEVLTQRFSSVKEKVHVIYNPFPAYEDHGVGKDFGYFGGTDYLKGFGVLVHSMVFLRGRLENFKVHATKIEGLKRDFETKLANVGFVPYSKLKAEEFENMYGKVRGVLVPSIWPEPWPYVVVEALLRGRIVIGSNIGGIPEQVKGCKGVFLSEPGDSLGLARSIENVSSLSKDDISDLGSQNREAFLRKFNNDFSAIQFIGLCNSVLRAR